MTLALEQVRKMRGGAQSHLMRCSDGAYYVVKFQNNPQDVRILANELLGTRLAARIGLSVPKAAVVEVREELIVNTDDLAMQLGRGRAPCKAGLQFGSRYPGIPGERAIYDFLPDEQLVRVSNLADFCGMLVFDQWTCNTDGRQAIFFRGNGEPEYQAQMIDHGFCFNAGNWNFPDGPLRGIYLKRRVYDSVRGLESFEPWIARIESMVDDAILNQIAREIPPEWYEFEADKLSRMLAQLLRRRRLLRDLMTSAWKSSAQPFANWK